MQTRETPRPTSAGSMSAEVLRERHRQLEPHLDFMGRLADGVDDHDEPGLRSLLLAALDCTDDDVLPFLTECRTQAYPVLGSPSAPARQLLATQHRAIDRIRGELRSLVAGGLDAGDRRAAVRRGVDELVIRLRSLLDQQVEVCLPLLSPTQGP